MRDLTPLLSICVCFFIAWVLSIVLKPSNKEGSRHSLVEQCLAVVCYDTERLPGCTLVWTVLPDCSSVQGTATSLPLGGLISWLAFCLLHCIHQTLLWPPWVPSFGEPYLPVGFYFSTSGSVLGHFLKSSSCPPSTLLFFTVGHASFHSPFTACP